MIVIAIIGILASIVLVALASARDLAREASFKSTVKSLQSAWQVCCESNPNAALQALPGQDVCSDPSGGIYPSTLMEGYNLTITQACTDFLEGGVDMTIKPKEEYNRTDCNLIAKVSTNRVLVNCTPKGEIPL